MFVRCRYVQESKHNSHSVWMALNMLEGRRVPNHRALEHLKDSQFVICSFHAKRNNDGALLKNRSFDFPISLQSCYLTSQKFLLWNVQKLISKIQSRLRLVSECIFNIFDCFVSSFGFNLSLLFVISSNEHVFFSKILRYRFFIASETQCCGQCDNMMVFRTCFFLGLLNSNSNCSGDTLSVTLSMCMYVCMFAHQTTFLLAFFANINWIGVLWLRIQWE